MQPDTVSGQGAAKADDDERDHAHKMDVDRRDQNVDAYPAPTLTKVTANLIPRAVAALNVASSETGDNRTDVINRGLQVYAYLVAAMNEGKLIFVEDPTTGARERLVIL